MQTISTEVKRRSIHLIENITKDVASLCRYMADDDKFHARASQIGIDLETLKVDLENIETMHYILLERPEGGYEITNKRTGLIAYKSDAPFTDEVQWSELHDELRLCGIDPNDVQYGFSDRSI